jgi:hypothetical protein
MKDSMLQEGLSKAPNVGLGNGNNLCCNSMGINVRRAIRREFGCQISIALDMRIRKIYFGEGTDKLLC